MKVIKGKNPVDIDKQLLLDIHVDKKIYKSFEKAIKDGYIKNVKYVKTTQDAKDKKKMIVFVETKTRVNINDLQLGMSISAIKESIRKSKMMQKLKDDNDREPFRFAVPNEILKSLKASKEDLSIQKFVAHKEGYMTDVYFDMSMCLIEGDVVNRLLAIQDHIHALKLKYETKSDVNYIREIVNQLNKAVPEIYKTSASLVRMTGEELIRQGYADAFKNLDASSMIGRIYDYLTGQSNIEYYYCDRLVHPSHSYVVKLDKPMPCPRKKVSHEDEVALHYDFGQQYYDGLGAKYVEKYVDFIKKQIGQDEVIRK